jgi:hypothetical protein
MIMPYLIKVEMTTFAKGITSLYYNRSDLKAYSIFSRTRGCRRIRRKQYHRLAKEGLRGYIDYLIQNGGMSQKRLTYTLY